MTYRVNQVDIARRCEQGEKRAEARAAQTALSRQLAVSRSATVLIQGVPRTHAEAVALLVAPLRGPQPHPRINYAAREQQASIVQAQSQERVRANHAHIEQEQARIAQEQAQTKREQERVAQEQAQIKREQESVAQEQMQTAQAQARIAQEQARTAMALAQITSNLAAHAHVAMPPNILSQIRVDQAEHKESNNEESDESDTGDWQKI